MTVSPAMNLHALTADLATIKSSIAGMVQKKGFTNTAQPFALAEIMYTSMHQGSSVLEADEGL